MSMNLYCKEVELWQTPTHITYMCLSNGDGGRKGCLYRYKEWCKSTLNGVWRDDYELKQARLRLAEHFDQLDKHKTLHFSMI